MEDKLLRFLTAIKEDIEKTFVKSIISTLNSNQKVVMGNYYFEVNSQNNQVSRLFIDYAINVAQIIPEPKITSVHFEIYNKTFSELEPYLKNIEEFLAKGGIYPNVIFFPIIFAKKDANNIGGTIIIPRITDISSEERPPLPPLPNSDLFPTLSSSDPNMTSKQHRRITEQKANQVISTISSVLSFENPVLIPQEILKKIPFCTYLLFQAILLMNVVLPDVIQKIPELKKSFNDIYINPNNINAYNLFYQKIKNPYPFKDSSSCSKFFLHNFYTFYQKVETKPPRLFTINNTYYLKLANSFSKNFYDYFTFRRNPQSTDFPDYLIIQTDQTETLPAEIPVKSYAIPEQSKNGTPVYQYLYGFSNDHDLVIAQNKKYLITTSKKEELTFEYDDSKVNSYIKSLQILIYVMTFRN